MTTLNANPREAAALHDYESRHGEGSWLRDWAWLIGLRRAEG